MQCAGASVGTFLTWYFSAVDANNVPIPSPPLLCPSLVVTRDANNSKFGCKIDDMYGYIFAYEFVGSVLLIFSWLILRNYQIGQDFANRKLEAFAKCAILPIIYMSSMSIGDRSSGVVSGSWSNGGHFGTILNPTLAL